MVISNTYMYVCVDTRTRLISNTKELCQRALYTWWSKSDTITWFFLTNIVYIDIHKNNDFASIIITIESSAESIMLVVSQK